MTPFKLYTDEDITDLLARTLRGRGFDIVSAHEAATRASTDAEQLAFAAEQQRALLTFNVRDFVLLHNQYVAEGREHWGVIVSTQIAFPELLRRVLKLLDTLPAEAMRSRLEWLNTYR